jgi:hypothetical protein
MTERVHEVDKSSIAPNPSARGKAPAAETVEALNGSHLGICRQENLKAMIDPVSRGLVGSHPTPDLGGFLEYEHRESGL